MNVQNLRSQLISTLQQIAPEIEECEIEDLEDLQESFDLDSVDIMNYIIKIQEALSIEIPNKEYRTFLTIDGALIYISAHAN